MTVTGSNVIFEFLGVSRDSKWEDSRLKIRKLLFIKLNNKPGEGGGGTPIHYLSGYVPPNGVVIDFEAPDLEWGIYFRGFF